MGITERIDAITHIPDAWREAAPPCPRSVKIELTARCNFACAFCARSARLRAQKDIDRGFYARIVREMAEAGVEELGMFYLGESCLVPWLPEAITYAKEMGIDYVFLTTNGSITTPEKVESYMSAGLDSLKFSYNYADVEQFTEIAQVKPAYFNAMVRNLKDAWRIREEGGYDCGLYASYIAYDGEQGERMADALAEIEPYVDELYALPLYSQADLVGAEEKARDWRPTAGNRGRLDAMSDPIPCWSIFTEGHITWDGRLSACCFDHDGRFDMGDLTVTPFLEAWNSRRFQALRHAHLAGDVRSTACETCSAYG
jgi:hypothetical protein